MKTLLLTAALASISVMVNATTIFVTSSSLSTANNSGHGTVDLTGTLHPNPGWAAALSGSNWISYGSTGAHNDAGYFSPINGTVVIFTTSFLLSGSITGANLTVLADDTTSVVLNGHTLIAAHTARGPHCSSVPIGCVVSTEGILTFASLQPYLVDGANVFSFGVRQVGGSSFGLDFAGSVNDGGTPEPATLALIGAGLLALAACRRRK